jgi:hypothetical protein
LHAAPENINQRNELQLSRGEGNDEEGHATMKETRKQKIDRQRGYQADRIMRPIHGAIDRGDLVITPISADQELRQIVSGREYCPRCGSGPRQAVDVVECSDCGRQWDGSPLLTEPVP